MSGTRRWRSCRLLLAALLGALALAPATAQVLVGVRLDDYGGAPVQGPDTRLALERELFARLERLGVVPTVSVIPGGRNYLGEAVYPLTAPESAARVALLRELLGRGVIEVALHGETHEYPWWEPQGREFAGLSREEQRERLTRAKQSLEALLGMSVNTYVPPNNRYDRATLDALVDAGFGTLSGLVGLGTASRPELSYLPAACQWRFFEEAVRDAAGYPGPTLVVVMLHAFDLGPSAAGRPETSLPEVEATLERLRDVPGVQFTSLGRVAREYPELGRAGHFRAAATLYPFYSSRSLQRVVDYAMQGRSRWPFWPEVTYRRARWVAALPYVAGGLLGLVIGLPLAWGLGRRARPGWLVTICELAAAVGLAVLVQTWWGQMDFPLRKQVPATALAVAALLALGGATRRVRR